MAGPSRNIAAKMPNHDREACDEVRTTQPSSRVQDELSLRTLGRTYPQCAADSDTSDIDMIVAVRGRRSRSSTSGMSSNVERAISCPARVQTTFPHLPSPALTDIGITTLPSGRETSHVVAFSSPSTMTAAPGRNPEAGDYTIECPGHGIGSRTKARIASGLRVSRLGFERH